VMDENFMVNQQRLSGTYRGRKGLLHHDVKYGRGEISREEEEPAQTQLKHSAMYDFVGCQYIPFDECIPTSLKAEDRGLTARPWGRIWDSILLTAAISCWLQSVQRALSTSTTAAESTQTGHQSLMLTAEAAHYRYCWILHR